MNVLDIALLVSAGIGLFIGYRSGLVKLLSFGVGITVGLLQAVLFYNEVGENIHALTDWEQWICSATAFVLVFAAVAACVIVLGRILRLILKAILLGLVDRLLGAILSAAIAITVLVAAVNTSAELMPDNNITGKTTQKQSLLYKKIAEKTFLIIEEAKID